MSSRVLITGAAKGFGRLTAETLLKTGHTVIASMRDPEGRNKEHAEALKAMGAKIVEIDVTDDKSVQSGIDKAIADAGGVDVMVNNAGVGAIGLQETFEISDWQKIFDLNVFGVQRMNRAILPHMRQRGNGLLIHVSSLLGRFVLPFFGPYNSSKHALEALADNYRVELSGSGIESVIVEPGGFGTDFHANLVAASDRQRLETYGEFANAPQNMMSSFEKNYESDDAPDPQMVADAILNVIDAPRGNRPFRTVVDGMGAGMMIENINRASAEAMQGIYSRIGMEGMLKIK